MAIGKVNIAASNEKVYLPSDPATTGMSLFSAVYNDFNAIQCNDASGNYYTFEINVTSKYITRKKYNASGTLIETINSAVLPNVTTVYATTSQPFLHKRKIHVCVLTTSSTKLIYQYDENLNFIKSTTGCTNLQQATSTSGLNAVRAIRDDGVHAWCNGSGNLVLYDSTGTQLRIYALRSSSYTYGILRFISPLYIVGYDGAGWVVLMRTDITSYNYYNPNTIQQLAIRLIETIDTKNI